MKSSAAVLLLSATVWLSATEGFVHRQRRDATTTADCTGVHGVRKHQEIWIYEGWQFQCVNGRTKVVGCVATPRGNNQTIAVNSTVVVNGFWHNCSESGNAVKYTEESSCIYGGKEVHVNETFPKGNFKMKCQEFGYDIAGCYYNASDGTVKDIPVGTTNFSDGRFEYSCTRDISGGVRYFMSANSCEQDGKIYKKGETWKAKNFKFVCGDQGSYKITHCWSGETSNVEVEIGQSQTKDGVTHQCTRVGNVVLYHTSSGGGTGCNPFTDPNCSRTAQPPGNQIPLATTPQGGSNTLGGGQQTSVVLTGSSKWTSSTPQADANPFGSLGGQGDLGFVTFPLGPEQNVRFIQPAGK